jgi:transcriptional regulator with XRE-family HTH domain
MATDRVEMFVEQLLAPADTTNESSPLNGRKIVADAILDARMERGWTQSELALRAETTQSRICEIENRTTNARIDTISRIASVLRLEVALLPSPSRMRWSDLEGSSSVLELGCLLEQFEIVTLVESQHERDRNLALAA